MDIEILQNQLAGVIEKGKGLRNNEAVFLKVKGLDEEIAKTKAEVETTTTKIEEIKKDLSALKDEKRKAIQSTAGALADSMAEILPEGKALFEINDDGVFIGWYKSGRRTPYDGLSGGEKATFDSALCHALKADFLVIEAAELDPKNLDSLLNKLKDSESQIIVNTCYMPDENMVIPEAFDTTLLYEEV